MPKNILTTIGFQDVFYIIKLILPEIKKNVNTIL